MIEIKQYKKIYITSIYEKTGGPKTLHQLAEFLVNQGVDVYMVYFENVGEFVSKDELLYEIIYVFLTIFLYLLKCPQSLIL